MVFHVPLTFSAVASHLLPGLQGASPFPLRGPRSPLTDGGGGGAPLDHQLTVRECLAAALCPEDNVAANLSGGASAHERFTRRLCLSGKSSQDVLFWNANTTGCGVRACRRVAPLFSLLLCQKCFTLLRGRGGGGGKKTNKTTHARTQCKHIRVDSQTARQPMSARFRFYVTVTYIQCSVQRHFLNL